MKMRKLHGYASVLLLLIFLGSKSLEYHNVSHTDGDSTECEWCDFALLLHTTPFEPVREVTPEIPLAFAEPVQSEYSYSQALTGKDLYFRNFSRPPPSCG